MKILRYLYILFFLIIISCTNENNKSTVSSPDGNINLFFEIQNGQLQYQIKKNNNQIVDVSKLGMILESGLNLGQDIELVDFETDEFNEIWNPIFGELSEIKNNYKSLNISLKKNNIKFQIIFRVYDDGGSV